MVEHKVVVPLPVYHAGQRAYCHGVARYENPFCGEDNGTEAERRVWDMGWRQAEADCKEAGVA